MTSSHTSPLVTTKVIYFFIAATVVVFVSMLLMTGLHL
jgi:hypothetical protein